MATVTGITAERAQQIENASITGARLEGENLILTKRDGTDINVGVVVGASGTNGNDLLVLDYGTVIPPETPSGTIVIERLV